MTSDSDDAAIANEVYSADPGWTNPPIARGRHFTDGQGGTIFEVIDEPVNDPVTGFQAITVAPLVNGTPDLSRLYVSYAGTNPAHHGDLNTENLLRPIAPPGSLCATEAVIYCEDAAEVPM